MVVLARMLIPLVLMFAGSWLLRAVLRSYLRRRNSPPGAPGKSSARVVEGNYRVKEEEEEGQGAAPP